MKCPVCTNVDLLMSNRQGVEIDYCPTCRGVWLDRGELDKIIEREQGGASGRYPSEPPSRQAPPPPPQPQSIQSHDQHYRPEHHSKRGDHHEYKEHGYGHGQRRKKSFFEELFD
jgi:uncharacterized protein